MKLFLFNQTSAVAAGGEETLRAAGEGRAVRPDLSTPAGREAFAGLLTTRGQRAAAARRARGR